MAGETLTGRRRFRAKWRLFGRPLLVLQVEYTVPARECTSAEYGLVDTYTIPAFTDWRDATVEDISNG